jgi:hypothetical protein
MSACYEFTINSYGFTGSKKNRKADLFQTYVTIIISYVRRSVGLHFLYIRVWLQSAGKPIKMNVIQKETVYFNRTMPAIIRRTIARK